MHFLSPDTPVVFLENQQGNPIFPFKCLDPYPLPFVSHFGYGALDTFLLLCLIIRLSVFKKIPEYESLLNTFTSTITYPELPFFWSILTSL